MYSLVTVKIIVMIYIKDPTKTTLNSPAQPQVSFVDLVSCLTTMQSSSSCTADILILIFGGVVLITCMISLGFEAVTFAHMS